MRHSRGGFLDSFEDLLIAGAPAQVPGDRFLDSFAGGSRLFEERFAVIRIPGVQ